MDVVRYIDHDFWAEARRELRAVKPGAYLLAEVMGDAGRWLAGDEFDATMNYTFRDLCVDFFAKGAIDGAALLEGFLEMTAMYSPAVTAMSHNLIGSHDMPRFLTEAGGDIDRLTLATLFQLTVPGQGCITATRWRWPAVTIRPTVERSPGTVATRFTGTGCVRYSRSAGGGRRCVSAGGGCSPTTATPSPTSASPDRHLTSPSAPLSPSTWVPER